MLSLHAQVHDPPRIAELGRLVKIGRGLFARLAEHDGTFWGFFSGPDGFGALAFDTDWKPLGPGHWLTPEGQREVDQDIAFDETGVYQFAMLPDCCGIVRKFDWDFRLVRSTPVLRAGEGEVILDQHVYAAGGRVWVGTEFRESPRQWGRGPAQNLPPDGAVARGVHVRVYDPELNLLDERDLRGEAAGAAVPTQVWGLGSSQLRVGDRHCVVAASPIGNLAAFSRGESVGARQLFVLRFDGALRFVDSCGPLGDSDCDNFWPTGSAWDGTRCYVSYTCRRTRDGPVLGPQGGGPDQGWIRLGIFDSEFHELETVEVTPRASDTAAGDWHRSDVLKVGDRVFVAFDGAGGAWVREVRLRD